MVTFQNHFKATIKLKQKIKKLAQSGVGQLHKLCHIYTGATIEQVTDEIQTLLAINKINQFNLSLKQ